MATLKKLLTRYDYAVSSDRIAQEPASPRDSARLLVYNRKKEAVMHDTFLNLADYLPHNAILVFNKTKVIPARFSVTKETGGKATITYVETHAPHMQVMADRRLPVGSRLILSHTISFTVARQEQKYYFLLPSFPVKNLFEILERHGTMPIPPYIKHSPLTRAQLKKKYQTIFAQKNGSIAAPTASLHFTKRLLTRLKKQGVTIAYTTLHVGLGTFAPLTQENISRGTLHHEWYQIDQKTVALLTQAKKEKRPIIAAGTTVVRTLESASNARGHIVRPLGTTDLFIREGYHFKFTTGLITNFHVPQSSLLMLVSAFVGRKKILSLYQKAADKNYRFFSFGDGMFIA
ncbi:MAG: tRNA preQ1(34) S-adenosylmethionine ribosyltransferase-isomerase QueA [Candidatus Paceibacterota bacterium]|jgi:S-adenosylmethionine:tRNA ribosyltransferase-isomerase